MHLRKENALSLLEQHLFPRGDRVKMLAHGFLDLFFDAAPRVEYIFQFFELSIKALVALWPAILRFAAAWRP